FDRTFEVAARNFEDVIQHLFPGGQGRLRLVKAPRPRAVLGGGDEVEPNEGAAEEPGPEPFAGPSAGVSADGDSSPDHDAPGIEMKFTPAGKSGQARRHLSGGAESLVALAFPFTGVRAL